MKGICYVVGAGNVAGIAPKLAHEDFVIAADGGFAHLQTMGIAPHLVLGDFDSLGYVPQEEEAIVLPTEKDDTDMLYAVRQGLQRGYTRFVIYGGLGGRMDHSVANMQVLAFLTTQGAQGYLVGEGTTMTAISGGVLTLDKGHEGYVSVFSLSNRATAVTLTGLKYTVTDATLENTFPIGVSNEFLGQEATISVEHGTLAVLWQADNPTTFSWFLGE